MLFQFCSECDILFRSPVNHYCNLTFCFAPLLSLPFLFHSVSPCSPSVLLTESSSFTAYDAEEDFAVFGRYPPESVRLPADAVCGQAAQYTLQGSGSHGGHPGLSQGRDAAGWDTTGTTCARVVMATSVQVEKSIQTPTFSLSVKLWEKLWICVVWILLMISRKLIICCSVPSLCRTV